MMRLLELSVIMAVTNSRKGIYDIYFPTCLITKLLFTCEPCPICLTDLQNCGKMPVLSSRIDYAVTVQYLPTVKGLQDVSSSFCCYKQLSSPQLLDYLKRMCLCFYAASLFLYCRRGWQQKKS